MGSSDAILTETPPSADAFGVRRIRTHGGDVENVLEIRQDISGVGTFEFAVRERIARLENFSHPSFVSVRRAERLTTRERTIAIVSDAVEGTRLSDVLSTAVEQRFQVPAVWALNVLRHLAEALSALHATGTDVSHGVLAPNRVLVAADSNPLILDYVLGPAIEQLHYSAERYWTDFGIPTIPDTPAFDQRLDLFQIGVIGLALFAERPVLRETLSRETLRQSVNSVFATGDLASMRLDAKRWLAQMLRVDAPFASAAQAATEINLILDRHHLRVAELTVAPDWFSAGSRQAPDHAPDLNDRPTSENVGDERGRRYASDGPPTVVSSAHDVRRAGSLGSVHLGGLDKAAVTDGTGGSENLDVASPPSAPTSARSPVSESARPSADAAETLLQVSQHQRLEAEPVVAVSAEPTSSAAVKTMQRPTDTGVSSHAPSTSVRPAVAAATDVSSQFRASESDVPHVESISAAERQIQPSGRDEIIARADVPGLFRDEEPPSAGHQTYGLKRRPYQAFALLVPILGLGLWHYAITTHEALPDSAAATSAIAPQRADAGRRGDVRQEPASAQGSVAKAPAALTATTGERTSPAAAASGRDTISMQRGQSTPATASLAAPVAQAAAGGWITVRSATELQILEHDRRIGTTGSGRLRLAAGTHQLDLVNTVAGFRAHRTVTIDAGAVTTVTVDMPRGLIAINALPWAEVWLDDQRLGSTPLGNVVATVGNHEVVFRHPTLGEQRRIIVVPVTGIARTSVNMNVKSDGE